MSELERYQRDTWFVALAIEIAMTLTGAVTVVAFVRACRAGFFSKAMWPLSVVGLVGAFFLVYGSLQLARRFGVWPFTSKSGGAE